MPNMLLSAPTLILCEEKWLYWKFFQMQTCGRLWFPSYLACILFSKFGGNKAGNEGTNQLVCIEVSCLGIYSFLSIVPYFYQQNTSWWVIKLDKGCLKHPNPNINIGCILIQSHLTQHLKPVKHSNSCDK